MTYVKDLYDRIASVREHKRLSREEELFLCSIFNKGKDRDEIFEYFFMQYYKLGVYKVNIQTAYKIYLSEEERDEAILFSIYKAMEKYDNTYPFGTLFATILVNKCREFIRSLYYKSHLINRDALSIEVLDKRAYRFSTDDDKTEDPVILHETIKANDKSDIPDFTTVDFLEIILEVQKNSSDRKKWHYDAFIDKIFNELSTEEIMEKYNVSQSYTSRLMKRIRENLLMPFKNAEYIRISNGVFGGINT